MAKKYLYNVFKPTSIPILKGRGSSRGARGNGSGARDGGREDTQLGGGCGKCYIIPSGLEVEAFDGVIIGSVSIYFRSTSVLFDMGSTFPCLSHIYNTSVAFQSSLNSICIFVNS